MSNRIEDLEHVTQGMCNEFMLRTEAAGFRLRVTHTLRTLDEQQHLYAKGRSILSDVPCRCQKTPGKCSLHPMGGIVTKARPGESPHNYGAAFDICFSHWKNANGLWEAVSPYPKVPEWWAKLGEIGEGEIGLNWGGPRGPHDNFTFDSPHFERKDWRTLRG